MAPIIFKVGSPGHVHVLLEIVSIIMRCREYYFSSETWIDLDCFLAFSWSHCVQCLSINFKHFWLLQNQWAIFKLTSHNASLDEGDSLLLKRKATPSFLGRWLRNKEKLVGHWNSFKSSEQQNWAGIGLPGEHCGPWTSSFVGFRSKLSWQKMNDISNINEV